MDLADSGGFHRAVARLYHQKDNSLVRALNKALFLIKLGRIGDLATYSTRNLSINIVGHLVVDCRLLFVGLKFVIGNATPSMKEILWRCRSVSVDFKFETSRASVLLLLLSKRGL